MDALTSKGSNPIAEAVEVSFINSLLFMIIGVTLIEILQH